MYAEKDRAVPRIPRDPLPSLVCLLLRQRLGDPVSPEVLGWPTAHGVLYVPADDGLCLAWDAAGAVAALGEVVDATGLPLTAVAYQWLFDPARVAASVLAHGLTTRWWTIWSGWPTPGGGLTTPWAGAACCLRRARICGWWWRC